MRLLPIARPRHGPRHRPLEQLSDPLDRWLYFLRHGDTLDADAVSPELDSPAIRRALKELQMLSQTELERDRYERRQMAIRDDMARREDALTEGLQKGLQEGRQEGALVERVVLFETLLNRPASNKDDLYNLPHDELQQRADALERELRQSRNGNASTEAI